MSLLKNNDEVLTESATVLIISDSENSVLSTPQRRLAGDAKQSTEEAPSASKKQKIDGEPNEEPPIDIDSIYTNQLRTRRKVSSDTSSKFPVSSPSDTVPLAGHRKKYVKNTLPAGAFERLQEIAQCYPPITFKEKLSNWVCCEELSDVEDVNNFDDQFQKREKLYSRSSAARRSAGKAYPYPNYNYQHFRSVVLENLKGSPVNSQDSTTKSPSQQPSCSKEIALSARASPTIKLDSNNVTIYEKILCPSSESTATKASPSIRLHWTDEESVFRCNRLNPDIDKYSQLIKIRIDYKKQINLKAKIKEIFKTPTIPMKYSSPAMEMAGGRKSTDASGSETKSVDDHQPREIVERQIETRRSTGGKSAESSRRSSERKSLEKKSLEMKNTGRRSSDRRGTERRSSERFPEANTYQQDEFCNYLGLGMNGKVYSPTPTDNKRRSLRVKRLLVQPDAKKGDKKMKEKDSKKKKNSLEQDDHGKEEKEEEHEEEKEEVSTTTTVNENRCSIITSPSTVKDIEQVTSDDPFASKSPAPVPEPNTISKTPEIKILTQLRTKALPLHLGNTPSSVTTANSTPPPTTRRLRRTRATSNGTSTCPRSSQSDESPSKAGLRRRRLNHHPNDRNDHRSDLSESLLSDPPQPNVSLSLQQHNGRTSTVPSSEGKKVDFEAARKVDVIIHKDQSENVHDKYKRYLEESRKTKPSIFIVESINNSGFKPLNCTIKNSDTVIPKESLSKEKKIHKAKQWPKKKKRVLRRLLRRNGTVVGSLNQRTLRKRAVTMTSRIKISKHQKVQVMKKKMIQMQLADANAHEKEVTNLNERKEIDKEEDEVVEVPPEENYQFEDEMAIEVSKIKMKPKVNSKKVQCSIFQEDPLSLGIPEEKPKVIETCDVEIQTEACTPPLPITFLTSPSCHMPNPLTPENGRVIYAFYELDILTIVQDFMVTFWKTSKLIQVMGGDSTEEWFYLGECRRLLSDTEISVPYKNRICVHNSIPIYMEMRAKELLKQNRDCDLISVYVNVYYYHDEDLVAKSHSIQLDTVPSLPENVVYTTITDSRYFVMCWSQEMMFGKSLSGLCKYSLTPHLDTLASIREFKSMRHEIRYLECTTDDNLIGFGDSQVTLWDHRSGDILMNYDLEMKIGNNIGSLHFPPLEVGLAKTILIFQKTSAQELLIIAINVSHNAPSHQLICKHILPTEFENLQSTMGIDDYTILTNTEHQELWIDNSDPQYIMQIKIPEGQSRFYSHCKQNVIVLTENHLALETFSSFVLKMINNPDGIRT